MHPNWFRIGGVAQDLPKGWDTLIRDFLKYLPPRLREYDKEVMQNRIFKGRTQGVGVRFPADEKSRALRQKIEEILGTSLSSAKPTQTI